MGRVVRVGGGWAWELLHITGIGHPGRGFLGRLANMGDPKKGGARDNTQYTCWTAPSFAAHHGMCISAECVYADALLLSLGVMRIKSASARA